MEAIVGGGKREERGRKVMREERRPDKRVLNGVVLVKKELQFSI
jgi:hypothetical protein